MRLVDLFWHSHFKHWLKQLQQYQEKQQKEALDLVKMEARTTNEDVRKLKAMKTAIFGNYISRVPVYDYERYKDGENAHLYVWIALCLLQHFLIPSLLRGSFSSFARIGSTSSPSLGPGKRKGEVEYRSSSRTAPYR